MIIEMEKQCGRSKQEIAEELRILRVLINRVPRTTAFGDDNQAAIRAQIQLIEHRMDFDAVNDAFDDEPDYTLSNAYDALQWLEGDDDDPPSEAWKKLIAA